VVHFEIHVSGPMDGFNDTDLLIQIAFIGFMFHLITASELLSLLNPCPWGVSAKGVRTASSLDSHLNWFVFASIWVACLDRIPVGRNLVVEALDGHRCDARQPEAHGALPNMN
jgi:hypothetical protein